MGLHCPLVAIAGVAGHQCLDLDGAIKWEQGGSNSSLSLPSYFLILYPKLPRDLKTAFS